MKSRGKQKDILYSESQDLQCADRFMYSYTTQHRDGRT